MQVAQLAVTLQLLPQQFLGRSKFRKKFWPKRLLISHVANDVQLAPAQVSLQLLLARADLDPGKQGDHGQPATKPEGQKREQPTRRRIPNTVANPPNRTRLQLHNRELVGTATDFSRTVVSITNRCKLTGVTAPLTELAYTVSFKTNSNSSSPSRFRKGLSGDGSIGNS